MYVFMSVCVLDINVRDSVHLSVYWVLIDPGLREVHNLITIICPAGQFSQRGGGVYHLLESMYLRNTIIFY